MCFKLASMRHKNQAWIRPTWWISRTTCSRACDSLQRLPARKGFQPAKAPSLQRPPACKGSLMAKTMLCMQRLLTKQLLPKGCEAVGVGLHGVVGQEKNIAAKVAQTHMRMTMSQHAHTHKQHTADTKPKQKLHTHTHATLTQTHATTHTHTTKTQMHRAYKIQT